MIKKTAILITTKNRRDDLLFTLGKIEHLIHREDVECVICDDGSTDGTLKMVEENFPKIILIRNEKSKGYMFNRNLMLNATTADYAVSLDDDAHFLSENPLEEIENYFENNPKCGVIACRIFWGKDEPKTLISNEKPERVKGFVGCGHVWNMQAWKAIPDYPEWFVFYGEEDFASYQLFQKDWEIHYNPEIFVQHRVDVKARKNDKDYRLRLRRSFRSGWYLYFLFYPWKVIPKKLIYTLWIQLKNRIFKGDVNGTIGLLQAIGDVLLNFPRLMKESSRFSLQEMKKYVSLPETKVYWNYNNEK